MLLCNFCFTVNAEPIFFLLKIIPTIHKTYKFEEMPKAFETFAGGHLRGKIVVDFQ